MALCRFLAKSDTPGSATWGWVRGSKVYPLPHEAVNRVFSDPPPDGLAALDRFAGGEPIAFAELEVAGSILAPVDPSHEVWAAGVTYESSKFARMCESADGGNHYANVYMADRPELFFKATPSRCVGQGGGVRIRADSAWNVPEPELAALIASDGTILGYTVGNDMSSREIEGANPLYLPQAKVYKACCALGPVVIPAQELDAQNLSVRLAIAREDCVVFEGETCTSRMRRAVHEIASWLFLENDYPTGVVMLTGTGIIPADDFTLEPGDEVVITIEGIGALRNTVVRG